MSQGHFSFLTGKARQGLRKKKSNFTPLISTGATFCSGQTQNICHMQQTAQGLQHNIATEITVLFKYGLKNATLHLPATSTMADKTDWYFWITSIEGRCGWLNYRLCFFGFPAWNASQRLAEVFLWKPCTSPRFSWLSNGNVKHEKIPLNNQN